ncbi:hypothetical protein MMC17_009018 [Xylographa soralifera]|nr:hypothetical protein [Xylographa soralifera]
MADPLSLSASIVAVLQLALTVAHYLHDVKGASDERQRLLNEVSSVSGTLYILKDFGERALQERLDEDWNAIVRSLQVPNGPLDQFKSALEKLALKFEPVGGLKRLAKTITWPFEKKEILSILEVIERQKSLFSLALQKDQSSLNLQIKALIDHLSMDVSQLLVASQYQTSRLQYQEMEALLNWLCPLDFPLQHRALLRRKQEGTGQWFIEATAFVEWFDRTASTLFYPGIPGAGKTMIAATVVDHLSRTIRDTDNGLAYIYCNYRDQAAQNATNLIASLLKQLIQQRRIAPDSLMRLHSRRKKSEPSKISEPSMDDMFPMLLSYITRFSQVFLVIDALDECLDHDGTRRQLLGKLRFLQKSGIVKLMITSRFIPNIQREFEHDSELEIRATKEDVETFLNAQMMCLPHCITRDTTLQIAIKDAIIQAVDGMFLLAQLHIDSLRGKTNARAVKAALARSPKGTNALDAAYDKAVMRIKTQLPDLRDLAEKALSWIVYARSSITPGELQHALAVESGDTELDEDALTDVEDILSSTIPQEYFERVGVKTFLSKAQLYVAETCFNYLLLRDPAFVENEGHHTLPKSIPNVERRSPENKLALLLYAGKNWADHVRGRFEGDLQHLIVNLFKKLSGHANCAYNVFETKQKNGRTPLAHAAYLNLLEIADLLMTKASADINARDDYGRTPLWTAAYLGHTSMVDLLLGANGIQPDIRERHRVTPLCVSIDQGHAEIARRLMDRADVDINARDSKSWTPLMLAAAFGHAQIVEVLVARDNIDLFAQDPHQRTALHLASRASAESIRILLDSAHISKLLGSIYIDSRDDQSRTPLSYILENQPHSLDLVKLFVERSALVDSRDNIGRTPLSYSVSAYSSWKIISPQPLTSADVNLEASRFLLDKGANVNSKDKYGRTPLSWLAGLSTGIEGHVKVADLLLQVGAEIDSKDLGGRTTLSWASGYSKKGARVDPVDNTGKTPLLYVTNMSKTPRPKYYPFTERNIYASFRRAPYLPVNEDSEARITKALLLGGADIEAVDNAGRTALLYAAEAGAEGVVELLINRGACVDVEDNEGHTPLWHAAERGHSMVVDIFRMGVSGESTGLTTPRTNAEGDIAPIVDLQDRSGCIQ